uniref:Bestrophin homolog n=1 Tax=Anopheles stephensi TaxID=30069 RepID=A0A182YL31_ANOST
MTVTYTAEVATCRGFGCFLKLLVRTLLILFRYMCLNEIITLKPPIPLSFVLGFYVTIVMTRWWNQYTSIPWPDPIAVFVSANIHGQDERGRVMRRTIMRYVCLCLTMVLTNISPRVKKRFPTIEHLVEAGLLNENEHTIMSHLNQKFPRHSKHWLPIVWAASIVTRARKEGRCRDDFASKTIIDELNKFRGQCGLLISYDTISVPLVYTQVVTLAVYSYFLTSVMGQQWVETKELGEGVVNKIDQYFPIFTTLQFFFYMGWLKVAESLINPFGEDDDDFEVNWMVDRNLQVSYLIVDEMHHEHPELLKDQYWDEIFPTELPHTVASAEIREEPPQPSTADIVVKKREAEVIPVVPTAVRIDEMVGKQNQAVEYNFPANPNDDEVSKRVRLTRTPSSLLRDGWLYFLNIHSVVDTGGGFNRYLGDGTLLSLYPSTPLLTYYIQSYNRTQSSVAHGFHSQLTPPGPDTLLSASAPETGRFEHNYVPLSPTDPDAVPMVASSTALRSMVDETDRVTTTFDSEETEKEQLERKTRLLARSISKQAVLGLIDTEMLLDELTKSTSDLEGSEHKKPPQNTPDGPTSDTNSNVDTTL